MSPRLRVYVTLIVLAALALLALHLPADGAARWVHYVLWTLACLVAELLWLPTLSGESTVSSASSANLATLMLWGSGPAMIAAAASTLVASVLFQRKPWIRSIFNAAQIVITMWVAGLVVMALGNPPHGLGPEGRLALDELGALRLMLVMLLGFLTYAAVNRVLVGVAVAWSSDRPYLRTLREEWFYRERVINDLALFFLAPLMVIAFGTVGYVGLLLFYAPLQMTYETHKRFLELRHAQNQLIHTERMAAKGEMAAEIGHELRNQLVAISGRAQMLLRDAQRGVQENVERNAQIILEQSKRMETMSKGLMEFSHKEIKVERVDMNALLQKSVEFVRTQNRFDGVEWDLRLAGAIPELRADPGQVQQVFINLFLNAADAMRDNGPISRTIGVMSELDDRVKQVRVLVTDTGTGIPANVLPQIFEPHFTTKPEGHGFGLSTSYRIVTNHGGRIVGTNLPGRGACFTVTLPLHGPGGWS
ncbi:MAG TPA: ATP-binding protein [Dongiaceae bacterium]|nr:ATP-binding protein [Dongiaceae bacterium]